MGLTRNTVAEVIKYLPASILSLGYPDRLLEHVDLKGSTLTCVDLIAHEGRERILDLGVLQDIGTFDLVIDSGCIEHVANIANAFINAASSIRVGGHIIHEIPMNMISHGYWNICPSWLTDFYNHNGFSIERMDRTTSGSTYDDSRLLPWPTQNPNQNFFLCAEPSLVLFVAKRTNNNPITLPKCESRWIH